MHNLAAVVYAICHVMCHMIASAEFYNVHKGSCYWWSYADSFFITASSLDQSGGVVVERYEKRSFVECCVSCDVSGGCAGVAYRVRECLLFGDGVDADSFSGGDDSEDNYKVMLYATEPTEQVWMELKQIQKKESCKGFKLIQLIYTSFACSSVELDQIIILQSFLYPTEVYFNNI